MKLKYISLLFCIFSSLTSTFCQQIIYSCDVGPNSDRINWKVLNLSVGSGQQQNTWTYDSGFGYSTNWAFVASYTSSPSNQSGSISNWLFSPQINLGTENTLKFYTIAASNSASDRLEGKKNFL